MKNKLVFAAMLVCLLAWGMTVVGCGDDSNKELNIPNETPKVTDFNISGAGTFDYNSEAKAVTVTAKTGKTSGVVSVYYTGTGKTEYEKSEDAPMFVGIYTVTFNVGEAPGWDAVEGLSAGTLSITDGTPSVPSNLSTTIASETSLRLSWSNVTGATSYKVYYMTDDMSELASAGTVTTNSYTHSGLTADKVYYYYVTSVNNYGQSDYSTFKPAKISIPDAPNTVEATPVSKTRINLKWSSVTGASSYKVYYSTGSSTNEKIFGKTLTETSGYIDNLNGETTYFIFITAVNAVGDGGYSEAVSATTFTNDRPDAPTNLRIVSGTTIQWNPVPRLPEYNEFEYRVYYELESSTAKYLIMEMSSPVSGIYGQNLSGGNPTQCTILGLAPNTLYRFYVCVSVRIYSAGGSITNMIGHYSEPLVVRTTTPLPPPPPLPPTPSSWIPPTTPPSGGGAGEKICTSNYCLRGKCISNSLLWTCNNGINSKTGKKCGQCNGTGKHSACNGTGKI